MDPFRGAGDKTVRLSKQQPAHIDRMEPIDIFIRVDCFHQSRRPKMRRQRLLNQDPIYGRIAIEFFDISDEFFFSGICGKFFVFGNNADI